jgi:hypothetical protein
LLPAELLRPGLCAGVLRSAELLPAAGMLPAADLLRPGCPDLLCAGRVLPAAGVLPGRAELLCSLRAHLLCSAGLL